MDQPKVTVVVPGHNAGPPLEACLAALAKQDWPSDHYELIYVDDCSDDMSLQVAARFADRIVKLSGSPGGPANARNLGVQKCSGEYIVFIDADVVPPPHTVSALIEPMINDPSLDAVFGSYDQKPGHPTVASQYRNLFHHYIHQISNPEASTFWAGCGAIRRKSFEQLGGFDVALYEVPMIEDIELGHRMRDRGMRIRLEKAIQVKHLKKWTVVGIMRADIFCRGIPWMRLLLSKRGRSNEMGDLNLKISAMASIPLVWSALAAGVLSFFHTSFLFVSLFLFAATLAINYPTFAFFCRVRGLLFAIMTIPLQLLYHACNGISAVLGILLHILVDRRHQALKRKSGHPAHSAGPKTSAIQTIECANRIH